MYWPAKVLVPVLVAVALLVAGGTLLLFPASAGPPSKTANLWAYDPFARIFALGVNLYAADHNLPMISRVSCVPGKPGHHACAFVFKDRCRLALIEYKGGEIKVLRSGRVRLPVAKCTIRNAFKKGIR